MIDKVISFIVEYICSKPLLVRMLRVAIDEDKKITHTTLSGGVSE